MVARGVGGDLAGLPCWKQPAARATSQRPEQQLAQGGAAPSGANEGGVSVGGFGRSSVADEDAAEVGEGLEMLSFAFVAADQAAVVEQP